jgi:hypothetical protein
MTSNLTSKFADAAASAGTVPAVGGSSSNSSSEILREGGSEGVEAASKGLEEASELLDRAFFGAPQNLSTRNMLNGLVFEALDADGDGRITQGISLHTHARTHAHTHTHTSMCTHTNTHTRTHARTLTRTYTHAHTHKAAANTEKEADSSNDALCC